MTGIQRQLQTGLGLVLLTALVAGCQIGPRYTQPVPEVIPAQVCGGNADSDGDGVSECDDRCPGTLRGEKVDPDGCPLPMVEQKVYKG